MTHNPVILQFKFSNYGDSMLQKMNTLRKQSRFCDVTVHINDLEVPGHRVVFAAGSPFLRDQFFLNDSKEVKISMFQDSEVGKQLLLSCYTGALEFPELELVNYLTVASFLQMGHIVEQCTRALSKFIKPRDALDDERRPKSPEKATELPAEPVAVDMDEEEEEEEEEDDDEVIMQPRSPPPQPEEENPDGEEDGAITIVKVESIADVSNSKLQNHFPSPVPAASLHSPEPQHSLINSTVDTRMGDIVAQQSQSYSVTTNAAALLSGKTAFGGHLRSSDKGLQWYHQCPKCARVFRQLENYANHLKMHKLFMCLLCGKTFTQKGNLHRHMRVHAGIKPFQCKICGKTFTQKCSLLDHLNLHSGDKPHKCNYCDMVFAHKPVLRKHLKQIHGKNSFDNANERNLQEVTIDFDYSRIQESNTDSNPALTIEEPM